MRSRQSPEPSHEAAGKNLRILINPISKTLEQQRISRRTFHEGVAKSLRQRLANQFALYKNPQSVSAGNNQIRSVPIAATLIFIIVRRLYATSYAFPASI
jgi:hypothetical protein